MDHGSEAAGTAGRTVVKGGKGVRGKADVTNRCFDMRIVQ